jgi:hypothetical protein
MTTYTFRVQIPAYTDRWMMGDRFGTVAKITRRKGKEIVHVLLDKSGRTMRFILADCQPVD